MNKKNNIFILPLEIILYIFTFMDITVLEKLSRMFKKNSNIYLYRFLYFEITQVLTKKIEELSYYRSYFIKKKLINNIEFQLTNLTNNIEPFIFVRNNIEDIGYNVRTVDLKTLYENKLNIINNDNNNLTVEQIILLFKKIDHSEKYCIFTQQHVISAESIGYENMFNSHINNCICRNIHQWCKGLYCEGCEKCNLLFPTENCLNIKQWDFRIPISSLPQFVPTHQRVHSL